MGCTSVVVAFSDLGEVLTEGLSVKPVANDFVQNEVVIPLVRPFVSPEYEKLTSDWVIGVGTLGGLKSIGAVSTSSKAILSSAEKASDMGGAAILIDATIKELK
ncbi:hypothetical protein [Vibrio genomosp. F10]|uniref:hypothetical protein n=1 Tax=Vibrio genomosp. F10 TaxID=723171 RepID=UPI00038048DB|nr:hypothetical protein [Vibrio genomosp. F10]OEF06356.1 hypothetical protein A1QI_18665 [Vibrio genomosp. F10 str. 9ZB36]